MNALKRIAALVLTCAAIGFSAAPAMAVDNPWTKSVKHYSVYTTGDVAVSTFFTAPVGVDRLKQALRVQATVTGYVTNAYEQYQICYTQPYGTTEVACTDDMDYTANQDTVEVLGKLKDKDGKAYTNVLAKGQFTIHHKLSGLTSPIYSDPGYDSIKVWY